MKKILSLFICVAMLFVFASCNNNSNTSSDNVSGASGDTNSTASMSDASVDNGPIVVPNEEIVANLEDALKINSDVVGWVVVPGTNVNYPVLQDPNGKNNPIDRVNEYYLERDIYKRKSRNAVIIGDDYCNFGTRDQLSRNTILYGHNWTNIEENGSEVRLNDESDVMFAQLLSFSNYDFAKKTPAIYFSTPEDSMVWVVFAAFYTDTSFNYILEEPDDQQFIGIVNGAKNRSQYNYGVDVMLNDKIITLSTCTRRLGSTREQRFVVMARLLRAGEAITDFGTPEINQNPLRPSWYTGNR